MIAEDVDQREEGQEGQAVLSPSASETEAAAVNMPAAIPATAAPLVEPVVASEVAPPVAPVAVVPNVPASMVEPTAVAAPVADVTVAYAAPSASIAEPDAAPMAADPAPEASPPPAPAVDIAASLESAGLQMVQTRFSAPPPAEDKPVLGRKPKPVVVLADEPLQMVETQRS
jgi:hypothetical protein